MKLAIQGLGFFISFEEEAFRILEVKQELCKIFRDNQEKSQIILLCSQEVPNNFARFPAMKLCFAQNFQG